MLEQERAPSARRRHRCLKPRTRSHRTESLRDPHLSQRVESSRVRRGSSGRLRPGSLHGFSVLELMVVVGIVGIIAAIAVPRFQSVILNHQLDTSVRGSQAVLKRAQSLAAKLNVPVVVEPVFGEQHELRVFADYWDADSSSSGSDLKFTVGSSDRVLLQWSLHGEGKLPLYFWSTLDRNPEGDHSIIGFTDNPAGEDQPPLMVFSPPSGRIRDLGALSISLAGGSEDRIACRALSVITLIGQTRILPCSQAPDLYEEDDDV